MAIRQVTRVEVVAEARSWVSVPYRHEGRDRSGLDCIGLIVAVGMALGQGSAAAFAAAAGPYPKLGDGKRLREGLARFMAPIRLAEAGPGDVIAFRCSFDWQHVGLLGEMHGALSIIHAHSLARPRGSRRIGACIEHSYVAPWPGRADAAFRYVGLIA